LVNDRHPPGTTIAPAPASDAAPSHYPPSGHQEAFYGDFTTYDGYGATVFDTGHHGSATSDTDFATETFDTDPLFGDMPGGGATGSGSYGSAQWSTGGHQMPTYDAYATQHQASYDTGGYDSAGWAAGSRHLGETTSEAYSPEATGQWDASGWPQTEQLGRAGHGESGPAQQWTGAHYLDTGANDATRWNSDDVQTCGGHGVGHHDPTSQEVRCQDTEGHESYEGDEHRASADGYERPSPGTFDQQATVAFQQVRPYGDEQSTGAGEFEGADDSSPPGADRHSRMADEEEVMPATSSASDAAGSPSDGRVAARAAARSRRRAPGKRSPAKRSAVLTIAIPSACVVGVAGIAAATVSGGHDEDNRTSASSSDATAVKPSTANNKLDTQLQNLSAEADDFADRASRTQERIDLKAQQEAEKRRAVAEAARKERLRPKFALPVSQNGVSAYYGQSGVNWMSVHTGIDFPVSYGTPVMAATDGTVRTQWNSAYGNMIIVTAKDGTETWYCHLSTYKVASGTTVKAGDTIAYSGNSGNSTGPHCHFEVRPGGGPAIDPLRWLRSHGLDPT
jgi:murein DD-endopeptidase MepM/ murein hydrolase activator NlpD